MNKKVIGYLIALVGLVILVFGAGGFKIPIVDLLGKSVVNIVAMVLVGLGVVLVVWGTESSGGGGGWFGSKKYPGQRKSKKGGKVQDLPVYEGDNIIAYRRD